MDIENLEKNWNAFANTDPLWSILTCPDKKGNKWQTDAFFEIGESEIREVMKYVEALNVNFRRRKALDFGCGVGRLTQPLSRYFDEVYGVDIAPSMIELARKYNRQGEKCKYYLNETNDLKLFPDNNFDFIYSNITLQHMEPRYSQKYIKEFIRVLAPQGLLIFQLPSKPIHLTERLRLQIKHILPTALLDLYRKKKYIEQPIMEMYGMKREKVVKLLEDNGAKIFNIIQDNGARILDKIQDKNATPTWISFIYHVTKE